MAGDVVGIYLGRWEKGMRMSLFGATMRGLFTVIVVCVLGMAAPSRAGETIIFNGEIAKLESFPAWMPVPPGTYGVYSTSSVTGNTVEMRNNLPGIPNSVYGGISHFTKVSGNSVLISGGTRIATTNAYGGYSIYAETSGNSVSVSGGRAIVRAYGGYSDQGTSRDNSVSIYDGEVRSAYGGSTGTGNVYKNSVSVYGGKVTMVYGGFSSMTGSISGNSVNIYGGEIDYVHGGYSAESQASGNSVTLSGGEITNYVYGGWSYMGSAVGNSINISDTVKLPNANVYGGVYNSFAPGFDPKGDFVTGNALHVTDWHNRQIKAIGNFDTISFNFSTAAVANTFAGGPAIIALTDAADFSNTALNPNPADNNPNNRSTTVSFNILGGSDALQPGATFTLIDKVDNADHYADSTIRTRQGTLVEYELATQWGGNGTALSVTNKSGGTIQGAKVTTQAHLGGISMLNRGGDLVVSDGISSLESSLSGHDAGGWSGLAVFTGARAGHDRAKTGSHIDTTGVSFLAGLGVKNSSGVGSLHLGTFFEAGYGDYDTSPFDSGGDVPSKGKGDTSYFGGGLMARYALQNGLYADGSARIGRSKNNLTSSGLTDESGREGRYNLSDTYYGAHFGLGYLWDLAACSRLDLSARYFWSHTGSNSFAFNDDPLFLDSVNSHRLRAGARYSHAITEFASPYVGAFYEYEFDGKSNGTAYNIIRLPESSLKGSTGVGELGMTCRVSRATVDFGVQGYVGRRQGVSGVMRVGMTF